MGSQGLKKVHASPCLPLPPLYVLNSGTALRVIRCFSCHVWNNTWQQILNEDSWYSKYLCAVWTVQFGKMKHLASWSFLIWIYKFLEWTPCPITRFLLISYGIVGYIWIYDSCPLGQRKMPVLSHFQCPDDNDLKIMILAICMKNITCSHYCSMHLFQLIVNTVK